MPIVSFVVLLLFFSSLMLSQTTFDGAWYGLLLWGGTLVPTLFPYMVLSGIIVRSGGLTLLGNVLYPVLGRLFCVSPAGSFAVLCGFLCGYPMGARVAAELVSSKKIRREEGAYLLTFVNNTSPAFVLHFLCAAQLNAPRAAAGFLIILYLSAYLTSLIFRRAHRVRSFSVLPAGQTPEPLLALLEDAVAKGVQSILTVGGYVVLFSVLIFQLSRLSGSRFLRIAGAFLEITNGIPLVIREIPWKNMQYIVLAALVSSGGVCSILQTHGMIAASGLRLRTVAAAKCVQTLIAVLLCFLWRFCLAAL